jgi:hypothetical protein
MPNAVSFELELHSIDRMEPWGTVPDRTAGRREPYVVDPAKLGQPMYQRDLASIEADNRDDAELTAEQAIAVGALSTTEIDAIDAALMARITARWRKVALAQR